jgi:predicted urease superfamily metal-dependent hydrolase
MSGEILMITKKGILKLYPNMCRIDVETIKEIVSNGQVVAYDELGIQHVLIVNNLRIARNRNMNEAKFEITFNADIAHSSSSFGSNWFNK